MSSTIDHSHASEEELALYAMAPEKADETARAHIAECDVCQAEILELKSLMHDLKSHLYRIDCPSLDDLESYTWGRLPADRRAEIERHLRRGCSFCADDLEAIRELRADDIWAQVRRIIAESPGSEPESAMAMRGPAQSEPESAMAMRGKDMIFVAEDIVLILGHTIDRGKFVLYGTISPRPKASGDQPSSHPSPTAARLLKLVEGDQQPVAAVLVGETAIQADFFEFGDLAPGQYRIEILLRDRLIEVPSLTLSHSEGSAD